MAKKWVCYRCRSVAQKEVIINRLDQEESPLGVYICDFCCEHLLAGAIFLDLHEKDDLPTNL